jgi:hypothetical protein
MAFKPGLSGNPLGRPVGIKQNPLKKWMENLLTDNTEILTADFLALKPAERIKIAVEMMTFITPKLKSVDATVENNNSNELPKVVEIQFIKDGEVKRIINDLQKKY